MSNLPPGTLTIYEQRKQSEDLHAVFIPDGKITSEDVATELLAAFGTRDAQIGRDAKLKGAVRYVVEKLFHDKKRVSFRGVHLKRVLAGYRGKLAAKKPRNPKKPLPPTRRKRTRP